MLQVPDHGVQRTSRRTSLRLGALIALAFAVVLGGLTAPASAAAADPVKVTIIVGPAHSSTAKYIGKARDYAALARSHGAQVVEVYSPNATWTRVKSAARDANILIYLGHGNGSPSPYGAFSALRRNGMGLNRSAGHGNANVKYYGQTLMRTGIDLDRNAVVLLNHLCYASGNSEPGRGDPSPGTARKRVDGYGTGFLRTGAKAVFANGRGSLDSILTDLLTSDKTVAEIFQDDPSFTGTRDVRHASRKTSGMTVWLDPYAKSRYYHSVVGKLTLTATQVRAG